MKRHFPKSIDSMRSITASDASGETEFNNQPDIPEDIQRYVEELRLLYYVPLSYIIADEELLPNESLRFFYIDENWTNALVDGALSIGRVTERDAEYDNLLLEQAMEGSNCRLHLPRLEKMHPQHLDSALNVFKAKGRLSQEFLQSTNDGGKLMLSDTETSGFVTGFIMRSELTGRVRDLNVTAYENDEPISELRLTKLSDDIIIGLYDGKITSLKISEPQTGLTFGLNEKETKLIPKDVNESNFGAPLDNKSIEIKDYTNSAGRIDVSKLASKLGESLNTEVKSAKLAFELITVASSAVFKEKGQ